MTRTFLELDQVVFVCDKEPSEFFGDGSWVDLEWMDRRVKDKSCYMDGVSDNDDFWYTRYVGSLIDTISNSKKLSLGRCNIGCIMDSFDNRPVLDVNVSNGCSNIVLDTYVWDDESMQVV